MINTNTNPINRNQATYIITYHFRLQFGFKLTEIGNREKIFKDSMTWNEIRRIPVYF
jgi:hypothetical protein